MENEKYLTDFFNEKEISYQNWVLTDKNGTTHFIDSDAVIEGIRNAPNSEQTEIVNILRKLDFYNNPIEPFLKHLGQAMVNVYADC